MSDSWIAGNLTENERLVAEMTEARFNSCTKLRGSNSDEYAIYAEAAKVLGWYVKSFDEWLDS